MCLAWFSSGISASDSQGKSFFDGFSIYIGLSGECSLESLQDLPISAT